MEVEQIPVSNAVCATCGWEHPIADADNPSDYDNHGDAREFDQVTGVFDSVACPSPSISWAV